jgi:hypothetical protein
MKFFAYLRKSVSSADPPVSISKWTSTTNCAFAFTSRGGRSRALFASRSRGGLGNSLSVTGRARDADGAGPISNACSTPLKASQPLRAIFRRRLTTRVVEPTTSAPAAEPLPRGQLPSARLVPTHDVLASTAKVYVVSAAGTGIAPFRRQNRRRTPIQVYPQTAGPRASGLQPPQFCLPLAVWRAISANEGRCDV